MPPSGPFQVVVHPYESLVRRSCAYEIGPTSARNALVDSDFSIFEFRLRSSFIGFGTSNLSNDVADISALVKYFEDWVRRRLCCWDCMEYADYAKHGNAPVDAFIMQGCVSDREAFELVMPNPQPSLDLAAKMIAEGKADDVMPMDMIPSVLNAPISAYRFQSLTAKGGDDDYFSDDFDDETISNFWARFQKPVLALHSAEDECVPDRVDQAALNKRYQKASAMVSPLSGVIPGASHTVAEPEAQKWFAKRVGDFLATLED
ncbi:hypothetical protein EDB81DRAFT_826557 [Dactylonectria macrodidyma]|uniref:Uncharacterized protein n=1 Tax=Dactylonectria macrodidyma TaxID=307937 RepID=A0A9P9I9T2_9HYPO|nr:hypothetical protein EDB81DRAFT_826557 [Dactylonectria macrodidyma]